MATPCADNSPRSLSVNTVRICTITKPLRMKITPNTMPSTLTRMLTPPTICQTRRLHAAGNNFQDASMYTSLPVNPTERAGVCQ